MKRLVLVLAVLLLSVVIGAFVLGRPYLTDVARRCLERELTRATGVPSRVEKLTVSFVPVSVHLEGVVVGTEPQLARVDRVDARLAVLASLTQGRPVMAVRVESPAVDLSHLPKSEPGPGPARAQQGSKLPPFHLKRLDLTQGELRFPMGNTTAHLTVASIAGELKTGLLLPGLVGRVEVHGAELRRKSYRARIDEIHADGGADAGGLFVNNATVNGERIAVTAKATAIPHRHAVSATFDPGILGVVVDELSFISGQAHVEGMLNGDLANPVLDARLGVGQGAIAGHVLGDLDTHVTRKGATLSFDDLHLTGTAGQLSGAVDITIYKETPIHGELNWERVDLERMLTIIGQPVPFSNLFNATTTVSGALDPLDLGVTANGSLHTADSDAPKPIANFVLSGRVRPHDLDAKLEVTQPQQNQVGARVVIEGTKLGGTVSLKSADLAALNGLLPRPVGALALTGQGDGTAAFAGTIEHPTVSGAVTLKDLTVAGAPVPRLGGDFAIAAGTLRSTTARLDAPAGGAEFSGVLALDGVALNDWRLSLRDLEADLVLGLVRGLARVAPPLSSGTLNGSVACRGAWLRAETQSDVVAKGLRLAREPFERIDVHATTALPQWSLRMKGIHAANESVSIDGAGEGRTRLQLTFDSTPLSLATWRGAGRRRVTGTAEFHGQVSGSTLRPGGSVQLTATGLGVSGHQFGDVALRADGADGDWTLQGSAFADAVDLAARLQTDAALPYTFTATWREAELAKLVSADPSLQVTTSGVLNLTGSLRALAAPSGSLQVARLVIQRDEGHIEAPEPIRIDFDHGHFRITSLAFAAPGSRLSISGGGTLPADAAVDIRGDADLVLMELIGRPFYSARGQMTVAAHLEHNAASGWALHGQATVREAALDLGLPVAFTDTSGSFTLSGGSVRIDNFGGRAGGGEFTVGGSLDLNRGPALSWMVHEVALTMPAWLEERISGQGQVQGSWRVMTVSGDIEVLNALYDRPIELTDVLPWFKQQVAPAPSAPGATEVHLDLHVHAPDGLFVDNNIAKAEMRADLRISGNTNNLKVSGPIEILNGEVTFRGRVFTISGGSIDFEDSFRINPALNITAETQVSTQEGEYTVIVSVSGTADNPRVQFSADDPGLSQNEVLSLVIFGKTAAQLQRETGGVGVGDVLSLVPSEYTGDVQKRVRKLFGVDRFEIEPAYVRYTGAIEPRVTIGKDITDRLRAAVSNSFGTEARSSVLLEYRVTRRISLLGTWESRTADEAGAFGGGVKFRYEFRKVPFSLWGSGDDPQARRNGG